MKKVKQRILDFLVVRRVAEPAQGADPVFGGAPGDGKTSLGRSVARALNRKFVRISLGGVRDEAEIRVTGRPMLELSQERSSKV